MSFDIKASGFISKPLQSQIENRFKQRIKVKNMRKTVNSVI